MLIDRRKTVMKLYMAIDIGKNMNEFRCELLKETNEFRRELMKRKQESNEM